MQQFNRPTCGKPMNTDEEGLSQLIDCRDQTNGPLTPDNNLDIINSFCYLGDTIGAGGGCDLNILTRITCAWGKFWELYLSKIVAKTDGQLLI